MRPLRNLNPRYEADSWIPAGATLNATTRIVGLYNRYCLQGPRAQLAAQLVRSNPDTAIVRSDATDPVEADAPQPTTIATGVPTRVAASKPVTKARHHNYAVQRGETLTSIAEKFQCDTGDLAQANGIKGPRYAIRPGQRLKLSGCQE